VNVEPHKVKGKGGRPSRWSIAKARQICNQIKRGLPLRYASPFCGIPYSTSKEWVALHPEFAPMMEEAHSFFVRSQIDNIERHSKISEKPSQWLLERRAKEEFAPAYVPSGASSGVQVLALGDDAIGKLMGAWGSLLSGQVAPQHLPDTTTLPTLVADNYTKGEATPQGEEVAVPAVEIEAETIKSVKYQRLGRPRKYPKPTPPAPDTPPPTTPPAHPL
jgi:hypothetical protein